MMVQQGSLQIVILPKDSIRSKQQIYTVRVLYNNVLPYWSMFTLI